MAAPQHDELSDTDKEMLECEALKACGDVAMAHRLVAAWFWCETRHHGEDRNRVIRASAGEVPPCDS